MLTVIIGISLWTLLDYIQSNRLQKIFYAQLVEELTRQSVDDRIHFNNHIKSHYTSAVLFVSQKKFIDYVDAQEWPAKEAIEVKYHYQAPPWLPDHSFSRPRFSILLDADGRVREVSSIHGAHPPQILLKPPARMLAKSIGQSFVAYRNNSYFVLASEKHLDAQGQLKAILMLTSPIDEEFLLAASAASMPGYLTALVTAGKESRILVSSNQSELPTGTRLSDLQDRYLVTGQETIDYGDAENMLNLASLTSMSEINTLTGAVITTGREQRNIIAPAFIVIFALSMICITRRINHLNRQMSEFSQKTFGVQAQELQKGDQLYLLENRFQDFTAEILEAREMLKKQAEEKTRLIVNNAFDAIITMDSNGVIMTWNPRAETIFGWTDKDVIGQRMINAIILPEDNASDEENLSHFLATVECAASHKQIELIARHHDGHKFPIELSCSNITSESGCICISIIRDITKRKQAEEEINNRIKHLEIINTVIKDVSSSLDIDNVLYKTTKNAAELINGDGASIAIYDEANKIVKYPYHYNMPPSLTEVVARMGQGLAAQITETKESVIINNYPDHPRALKAFSDAGLKVLIAVPLVANDKAFGALGVFGLTKETHFSQHDVELLESVGKEAAISIHNARLYDEIKQFSSTLEQKVKCRTRELEQSKEQLRLANEKLLELDHLKSMFIASMSHEFRTPLNSVIGFTDVLLQQLVGEVNTEQKDLLQRVKKSAYHLLSLINDVIDISKVEAGKIEPYIEECRLNDIINEAVSSISTQLEAKGLALETALTPNLIVTTDKRRLIQCLLNLLSNAVKFTDKGKITVTTEAVGDLLEITVMDTGIGIKEKDMADLFKSFVRLKSPSKTFTPPGTGLGLYLTKKLITEVLNGSISAKSSYGKGSIFTLRLPKAI